MKMGVSKRLHQMDRSSVDSEKWVIGGIELRSPMKPIFTKAMEKSDDDEEFSTTPTCAESRIPSRLPCPPAPKKRKSASSRCHYRAVREFFVHPDLETIFIRHLQGA